MKFSIRDLFLVTVIVAVCLAWWVARGLSPHFINRPESAQTVIHEVQLAEPDVGDKPKRRWFQLFYLPPQEFMCAKPLSIVMLFASFASTAASADEPGLAGEWRVKSEMLYGKPNPGQVGCIYKFAKDALVSFQYVGEKATPADGTVDFKAKPWTVDIALDHDRREVGGEGAREGIIELKGDVLTICVSAAAKKSHPKKFESKEGQFSVLIVLERVKKPCP